MHEDFPVLLFRALSRPERSPLRTLGAGLSGAVASTGGGGLSAEGFHLPASARITWALPMRLDASGAYHVRCRAEPDGLPAPRGGLAGGDHDEQTLNSPEGQ